jgi:hypothetical protein
VIATTTDLIDNFEQGKLGQFHHSDHVRMAFEYLCRYPALEALGRFSEALRRFAAAQGKPGLYHETITWAYVLIIRQRMAQSTAPQEWHEFAQNNPDLFVWKNGILSRYYSEDVLKSDLARKIFIFPDKQER